MVFRASAVSVVVLMVAGCGLARQQEMQQQAAKLNAQRDADNADCRQRFPTTPRTNHVALARCLNEVAARYWPDQSNRDLLELFVAKRMAIAAQVDAGKISEPEGEVLLAQARTEIVSTAQQRQNAHGLVAAQQQAADAASVQATANALQQAGAALQAAGAPPPPPPHPTTCLSQPWAGGVRTSCQ
jgi:hypothetical protein